MSTTTTEDRLTWIDDPSGHSEAKLGPLRLRIQKSDGRWEARIYRGRRLIRCFTGFRDIGEASLGAALYAEGYRHASEETTP